MKKHHYSIRNISVIKRLFYSFVLMSVIPLLIFALISYFMANNAIVNKTSAYSSQLINAISRNLQYEVQQYTNLADELMLNNLLQYALSPYDRISASINREKVEMSYWVPSVSGVDAPERYTNYNLWTSAQRYEFINRMRSNITGRMANAPYIRDVLLLDLEGNSLFGFGFSQLSGDKINTLLTNWQKNHQMNWLSLNDAGRNYVLYIQSIGQRSGSGSLGYIFVLINADAFSACLSTTDFGKNSAMLVLDLTGNVLAANNGTPLGGPLENDLMEQCIGASGILNNYEYGFEEGLIAYQKLSRQNWLLFSSIPNSYLRSEMNGITIPTLFLVLICLLFSFVVYRTMWSSITRPINRLVHLLSRASEQSFEISLQDRSRDELDFLERAYGQIVEDMRGMVVQIESEQRQKREYELKMLQAQINPHFLFNALNSLRFTAMMSKATNVSNGLAALSDLLKNTIIDKNEFIPIDEELKNIENYATIQQLRFGNIFSLQYDVSPEIREYYTIKFLLQPIVENSIIHGLNEDSSSNEIVICIRQQEEKLVIRISDNGKGFDVSKLNDETTKRRRLSGIGVNNVRQRILLYFGDGYDFHVESIQGQGTTVTVETPVLTEPPTGELENAEAGEDNE